MAPNYAHGGGLTRYPHDDGTVRLTVMRQWFSVVRLHDLRPQACVPLTSRMQEILCEAVGLLGHTFSATSAQGWMVLWGKVAAKMALLSSWGVPKQTVPIEERTRGQSWICLALLRKRSDEQGSTVQGSWMVVQAN